MVSPQVTTDCFKPVLLLRLEVYRQRYPVVLFLTLEWYLNAAQATNADVASKGATGSTIAFDTIPYIVARFKILVDDNNEDHGRPLCQRVQLFSIPGFIMVDDPDIALTATAAEIDSVKSYMKMDSFRVGGINNGSI